MSDLIERLRWVVSHMNEGSEGEEAVFDAISEIESLQARIEQLEPFERLAKMSGQNIGLRLMDAEARIAELEEENKQMKYDLNEGYTGYKPPEE